MFDLSAETLRFRSNLVAPAAGAVIVAVFLFASFAFLPIGSAGEALLRIEIFLLLILASGVFLTRPVTIGLSAAACVIMLIFSFAPAWPGQSGRGIPWATLAPAWALAAAAAWFGTRSVLAARAAHQQFVLNLNEENERFNLLQEEFRKAVSRGEAFSEKGARFRRLGEAAAVFGGTLNVCELESKIVLQADRIIPGGSPMLATVGGGKLVVRAAAEGSVLHAPAEDEFNLTVMRTGTVLSVADTGRDFRFKGGAAARCASLVAAPLFSEGKVVGVLRIDGARPDAFSTDDLRLLSILAQMASVALDNARLYARTEELAMVDGLTRLYKRWYFGSRYEEECQRARRYKLQLSLLMMDIDHFKKFNDTHGHVFGDAVLRTVAAIAKRCVREIDLAARYGGEEFVILLPSCDAEEARRIGESIRAAVEREAGAALTPPVPVTVSIGFASYPGDVANAAELQETADRALYAAKAAGRNRVVGAGAGAHA